MDLSTVRTGLAAISITGLDTAAFIPDAIDPPLLAVGRMRISYDKAMRGLQEVEITLHAFSSRADSQQGQDDLLPFMTESGATSVKAVIEADKTLGGACQTLRVESCEGPGLSDVGGIQFWSSTWTVRVWG